MNRRESKNTRHKNTNDPQKSTALERSVKQFSGGLKPVSGTNLTLSSDVDQDTSMFGLHERPIAYQCIISKKHINQDIKRRYLKQL